MTLTEATDVVLLAVNGGQIAAPDAAVLRPEVETLLPDMIAAAWRDLLAARVYNGGFASFAKDFTGQVIASAGYGLLTLPDKVVNIVGQPLISSVFSCNNEYVRVSSRPALKAVMAAAYSVEWPVQNAPLTPATSQIVFCADQVGCSVTVSYVPLPSPYLRDEEIRAHDGVIQAAIRAAVEHFRQQRGMPNEVIPNQEDVNRQPKLP